MATLPSVPAKATKQPVTQRVTPQQLKKQMMMWGSGF